MDLKKTKSDVLGDDIGIINFSIEQTIVFLKLEQLLNHGYAPKAQRNRSVTERHGHKIEDPYSWVRDEQWQQVLQQPEAMQGKFVTI